MCVFVKTQSSASDLPSGAQVYTGMPLGKLLWKEEQAFCQSQETDERPRTRSCTSEEPVSAHQRPQDLEGLCAARVPEAGTLRLHKKAVTGMRQLRIPPLLTRSSQSARVPKKENRPLTYYGFKARPFSLPLLKI